MSVRVVWPEERKAFGLRGEVPAHPGGDYVIDIQTPDEQAAGVGDLHEWHVVELSLEDRVELVVLHLGMERHTGNKSSIRTNASATPTGTEVVTIFCYEHVTNPADRRPVPEVGALADQDAAGHSIIGRDDRLVLRAIVGLVDARGGEVPLPALRPDDLRRGVRPRNHAAHSLVPHKVQPVRAVGDAEAGTVVGGRRIVGGGVSAVQELVSARRVRFARRRVDHYAWHDLRAFGRLKHEIHQSVQSSVSQSVNRIQPTDYLARPTSNTKLFLVVPL
eukprot:SAG31_NODE_1792_length_7256_cov_1.774626_2_plen_276_part_00